MEANIRLCITSGNLTMCERERARSDECTHYLFAHTLFALDVMCGFWIFIVFGAEIGMKRKKKTSSETTIWNIN